MVHANRVHARNIPERLHQSSVLVVDDQGTGTLNATPIAHLTDAGPVTPTLINLKFQKGNYFLDPK